MRKLWKSNAFWDTMGYLTLALVVVGQIAVGYVYLFAQFIYLFANIIGTVRDFALNLPRPNKVRDIAFTAITIGLIIIRVVR